jgi:hypothetical protein
LSFSRQINKYQVYATFFPFMPKEKYMIKLNRILTIITLSFFIVATAVWASSICQFSSGLECNKIGPKPAETSAKGDVFFQLDESRQEITYKLQVEKIKDVYMAHLHIGPSNKQGPMAVWLYPNNSVTRTIKGEFTGILAKGVIRPGDMEDGVTFEDLIESMRNGRTYVNVHTKNYIPGELRGQVQPQT